MDQRSGDGRFSGRIKIFAINCGQEPEFRNAGREDENSHFKKVICEEQKAQKEDRFLRGRQIAFPIYDFFRVTGAHTVLDCADLFSITLRDDNVQEFVTRWDEILSSMTNIPSDDILESLYK